MVNANNLHIGDISENGQITIIDEDRLCYLVQSTSKGATGIRTISKALLKEYIDYYNNYPNASANDARDALCGQSDIDKFEYGYSSTLRIMAKMALNQTGSDTYSIQKEKKKEAKLPLQQIYYGAPGTGKSHTIKNQTSEANKDGHVIRTTFHPDSDYSTFVGCYKPTTIEVPMRDVTGKVIKENGEDVTETHIVYEFVSQAFLEAYVNAWKLYAEAQEGEQPQPQYLIIEEINRGNCAQIFGDLFQLLDRNGTGFSDYPIKADNDLKKQLAKAFKGLSIIKKEEINAQYNGKDVVEKVLNGEELLLPNNLYIWATMNTSDQSLFPIDSAFKRRWDWKYVPISDGKEEWKIEVNKKRYDWWQFLQKINEQIETFSHSEDKKLGYYFCKAINSIISADTFVGKVIFYIWNDVFKDFADEAGGLFKDGNSTLSFNEFYAVNRNGNAVVVEEKVEKLLKNLGVSVIEEEYEDNDDEDEEDEKDETDDQLGQNQKDRSRFSINGQGHYNKRKVPFKAVSLFVQNHPNLSAQEIADEWYSLDLPIKQTVITSNEYTQKSNQTSNIDFPNTYYSLDLNNGEKIYIYNKFSLKRINGFIEKVNSQDWGIHIERKE